MAVSANECQGLGSGSEAQGSVEERNIVVTYHRNHENYTPRLAEHEGPCFAIVIIKVSLSSIVIVVCLCVRVQACVNGGVAVSQHKCGRPTLWNGVSSFLPTSRGFWGSNLSSLAYILGWQMPLPTRLSH